MPIEDGGRRRRAQRGLTYLEMIATATIVMILASAVMPLTRIARTRVKEAELRRSLREIRIAIDRYHYASVKGEFGINAQMQQKDYPKDLEQLVKGIGVINQAGDKKKKFLRRVPADPMTGSTEWGLRCIDDEPDSTSWCGDNVWDVYTKYQGKALDGTKYSEW